MKKTPVFPLEETTTLTISFFKNGDLECYSCSGEMSFFAQLILGVCLLHLVFLSDVSSDVTGVIRKYSANSAPLPKQFKHYTRHYSTIIFYSASWIRMADTFNTFH